MNVVKLNIQNDGGVLTYSKTVFSTKYQGNLIVIWITWGNKLCVKYIP